ncbi:MAG TPA: hypothetical protein VJI66_02650 [Candidatus Paceibacterota bacterium]
MKIYNISKGQFVTVWIFSITIWVLIINKSCNWYKEFYRCPPPALSSNTSSYDWLAVIVPFVIVFYTIGWMSNRRKKE